MIKIHSGRNLQLKLFSFSEEDRLEVRNNYPILPHTAILEFVCAALKISENAVIRTPKEFHTCKSPRDSFFFPPGHKM
jgi:hypothetical protein